MDADPTKGKEGTAKVTMRIFIIAIVIGTLAIITLGIFQPRQTAPQPSYTTSTSHVGYAVGDTAPNFTLTTLDGKKVSLSDYRGQNVMLNFWAADCASCLVEMPDLQQVYAAQQAAHKSFMLLGIDLGSNPPVSRHIVQQKGLTYPNLIDQNMVVGSLYNVNATPVSFLIDRQGIIRWTTPGPVSKESLQDTLKQLQPST